MCRVDLNLYLIIQVFVFSFQPSRCANQIEDVCKDIEKTINQTIQNTLNKLEEDCEKIATIIDDTMQEDT